MWLQHKSTAFIICQILHLKPVCSKSLVENLLHKGSDKSKIKSEIQNCRLHPQKAGFISGTFIPLLSLWSRLSQSITKQPCFMQINDGTLLIFGGCWHLKMQTVASYCYLEATKRTKIEHLHSFFMPSVSLSFLDRNTSSFEARSTHCTSTWHVQRISGFWPIERLLGRSFSDSKQIIGVGVERTERGRTVRRQKERRRWKSIRKSSYCLVKVLTSHVKLTCCKKTALVIMIAIYSASSFDDLSKFLLCAFAFATK